MKRRYQLGFCLLVSLLFLASCGGSEDDFDEDEDAVDVTGLWQGSVTLQDNGCNFLLDERSFSFAHRVTQFDSSVSLVEDAVEYVGHIVGDDGFSVDAPGEVSQGCAISYRYRYESINHDDDRTAQVRYFIIEECSDGSGCETSFAGESIRP